MRSALKYTAMPASVSCGTAHSTPLRVNWSDHRGLPVRCRVGAQHLCDVHQPAAVGVSGEVGVGQPEDVVGAAAGGVGAQRVEVGGIRHHVDPYLDVGVQAGEFVERFPVGGGDLLVPQAHGDDGAACGLGREPLKRAQRSRTTVLAVTAPRQVDPDFLALPRHQLADAALSAAVAAGADHADLRIHRIVNEVVALRDGELETSVVDREIGLAVRVIVGGTWGFASHAELDPDVAAETARRAVAVARALSPLNAETVALAPEPVYADVSWVSDYRTDPFTIAAADKIELLAEYSGRLLAADGVSHVSASLHAVKEQTFYADTAGSSITQQRVRVQPTLEAVTVDAAAGSFETMRTLAPPTARGWEAVEGDDVWNWTGELAELPTLLAEKVKAPSVTPGRATSSSTRPICGSPSTNPSDTQPNTTARSATRPLMRARRSRRRTSWARCGTAHR